MKINGVKRLTNYKWLNLFSIKYADVDGEPESWLMASRKDAPPLDGRAHSDAVVIVARHAAQNKLVLLHEFRLALNGRQYAFPAGLIDPGETVETTARRELWEETGLTLTEIIKVSPPLVSSAGLSDEAISIVFCKCTGEPRHVNQGSEEAETLLVSNDEALALARDTENVFDVRAWLILAGLDGRGFFSE